MPRKQNLAATLASQVVLCREISRIGPRRAALGLVLVVIVLVAISGGPGRALPGDRYALAFASAPTRIHLEPDGRELLLEFPGALPDGEAERVSRQLGPLLEGYSEGYGALRLRLASPVHAALGAPGIVDLTVDDDVVSSPEDDRRLALLEARQQARNGDLAGAQARLRRIIASRPGDLEPSLALAELETGASRWQHALGLYDGILRLFPEATDISRDRTALAFRSGPSVRVSGSAAFGPNGQRSQVGTLTGSFPLADGWVAGASIGATHDEIRNLRRSGGAAGADYSATKFLTSLSLTHNWSGPANTTRVDLFAASRTIGASVQQDVRTGLGQTTLGAIFHQPYWGTVMSFAADARRDQLGFAHVVPLPDDWQVQFGAGLIRYGIPSADSVALGPTALAGLSRGLPERWMPWSGLQTRFGYRMEAEYLSGTQTGLTAQGPLPLLDVRRREFHSLYGEASSPVGPGTATALLGYALDRFGGGGPQVSLRYVGGSDGDRLAFSAEAGVEPSLDLKPRTLFHVGGSLIWRFGDGGPR